MHRNAAHASVITGPWQHPAPAAAAPRRPERRKAAPVQNADALRAGLTPAQLTTLEALEIFKWRLAFVRRPLFQAPSRCCSIATTRATWSSRKTAAWTRASPSSCAPDLKFPSPHPTGKGCPTSLPRT